MAIVNAIASALHKLTRNAPLSMPAPPARAAPMLGADTQAVLARVGVGPDTLADLRERKIV